MKRLPAFLLLVLLLLPGCPFVIYEQVDGPWPMITMPDRPAVSTEPPFNAREQTLAHHAFVLEAKIKQANVEAAAHNASIPDL